jgi:hypothetical protein
MHDMHDDLVQMGKYGEMVGVSVFPQGLGQARQRNSQQW